MISYARTVTFWVPLLCLMLSCTLTAHALSVHANSQLSAGAEEQKLCFHPPEKLSKFEFCCTCAEASRAFTRAMWAKKFYLDNRQVLENKLPHWGSQVVNPMAQRQKKYLRDIENGYNFVKKCLTEFKRSCNANGNGYKIGAPYVEKQKPPHNSCPAKITSPSSCQTAAAKLHYTWKGTETSEHYPGGCYVHDNRDVWYNWASGMGRSSAMPICDKAGHGRRLLLDPTNEDEFLLDEGTARATGLDFLTGFLGLGEDAGATTNLQSSVKDTQGRLYLCPRWGVF